MNTSRQIRIAYFSGAIVMLLILIGGFWRTTRLQSAYSLKQFFPASHQLLDKEEVVKKTFLISENSAFLIRLYSKKGTWIQAENAKLLTTLTSEMAQIKGVKNVQSLGNLQMAIETTEELRIGPLFDIVPSKKWDGFIKSHTALSPQLISKDRKSALIAVAPQSSDSAILESVRAQIETKMKSLPKRVTASVSGVPALQLDVGKQIQTELLQFLLLSLALFCVLIYAFYKNVTAGLYCVLGLVGANVTTLGWLHLYGVSMNALTITLPILLSISFVSLFIHTVHAWAKHENMAHPDFHERVLATWSCVRQIFIPNLLSTITTSLGFFALVSSTIPAIKSYGLTVATAVLWSFFFTHVYFLFILPYFVPRLRSWNRKRAVWTAAFFRYRGPVLVATLALLLMILPQIRNLNFSTRLFDDLDAAHPARVAIKKMDAAFGGTVPLEIMLTGKKDHWKSPRRLKNLDKAVQDLRGIPGIGGALTITDFFDKVPKSSPLVSETYFLFSMSNADPLRHFVNADFSKARLALQLRDLSSDEIANVRKEVRNVLNRYLKDSRASEVGIAVTGHTMNAEVSRALVFGAWQSLLLIFIFLLVCFRSLRWAAVSVVPNLLPLAFLLGALGTLGTPIKPAVAIIFSIAFGLTFNNTIYLLMRFRELKSRYNDDTALTRTFLIEGQPCFAESLVTFAGFSIFAFSSFSLNQMFGAYMMLSVLAGAIGDLIVLPAFLRTFPFILKKGSRNQVMQEDLSTESLLRKAGAVALIVLIPLVAQKSFALTAKQILQKSRSALEAKTDQGQVALTIIEPNGEKKERKFGYKIMRAGETFKTVAKVSFPPDVKGTAFLAQTSKDSSQQWLYSPASGQVRKITAQSAGTSGLLGSELTAEDLDWTSLRGANPKLVKKDKKVSVIDVKPTAKQSSFQRVRIYIANAQHLPAKLEYFKGDKLAKTVSVSGYTRPAKGLYRPKKLSIHNLETNRKTDVALTHVQVNKKIPAKEFTQNALKRP